MEEKYYEIEVNGKKIDLTKLSDELKKEKCYVKRLMIILD